MLPHLSASGTANFELPIYFRKKDLQPRTSSRQMDLFSQPVFSTEINMFGPWVLLASLVVLATVPGNQGGPIGRARSADGNEKHFFSILLFSELRSTFWKFLEGKIARGLRRGGFFSLFYKFVSLFESW